MTQEQPNNPLHGMTLKAILTYLVEKFGWETLSEQIRIRCFQFDPNMKSSLRFLRRTPWARAKVEQLYIDDQNAPSATKNATNEGQPDASIAQSKKRSQNSS